MQCLNNIDLLFISHLPYHLMCIIMSYFVFSPLSSHISHISQFVHFLINATRVQRSLRSIILRERSQVLCKDYQGHLEMCVTDTIRENNQEVVGDCAEACADHTGAARLCKHQRDCVRELELVMMHTRLHRSL